MFIMKNMSHVYIVYTPKGVRGKKPIDFLILDHEAKTGEKVKTSEGYFEITELYGNKKIVLKPVPGN